MKGVIFLFIFMAVVVSITACGRPTLKTSKKEAVHIGKDIPEFSLKDPEGKAFSRKDILKHGAVFVVTAPILSDEKDQEGWARYLKATKRNAKGRLIFLQDMSPSSFKGKALSEMKKRSEPGKDPLLLIDPKGEMRKMLGVEKEATVVLVYNKKGRLVHKERGKPSRKSASLIWKFLE